MPGSDVDVMMIVITIMEKNCYIITIHRTICTPKLFTLYVTCPTQRYYLDIDLYAPKQKNLIAFHSLKEEKRRIPNKVEKKMNFFLLNIIVITISPFSSSSTIFHIRRSINICENLVMCSTIMMEEILFKNLLSPKSMTAHSMYSHIVSSYHNILPDFHTCLTISKRKHI